MCGLRSQAVVKVLLAEKALTLLTAIEKANSIAVASRDASELTATSGSAGSSVHAVRFKTGRVKGASDKASAARRSNTKPCYHCGR